MCWFTICKPCRRRRDANVKAALAAERARILQKQLRYKQNLGDGYVASCLGVKTADVPAEILALKREQLCLHRLAKEMQKASNNAKGELNEAQPKPS